MDLKEFLNEWHNERDVVLVHTSGSTGKPKPLWVEKRRMEASARITCRFLGLHEGDTALLCLPLDYIAGKMMVVRAVTCGLTLRPVEPSSHPLCGMADDDGEEGFDLAAMVPLQVYHSLRVPEERRLLMQIKNLIIGGGAVDAAMAEELKDFPHAVWSTYGMTETLSHIALRRLSGPDATEWYTPLDSVKVWLGDDGCLVIDAPQVCAQTLVTNDQAEIDAQGRFRILGRKDNVICSGGVKIRMEDVEAELRRHTATPLIITKCRDERLGEAVVLLTESEGTDVLRKLCQEVLPKYWQPRHYFRVRRLPFTETGKPARGKAQSLAALAIEI